MHGVGRAELAPEVAFFATRSERAIRWLRSYEGSPLS